MKVISRKELIRKLRELGFEGPKKTGAHLFMHKGSMYMRMPGTEQPEISVGLQQALLHQLEIDIPVWELA